MSLSNDMSSEAEELLLFMDNTSEIYRQKLSIIENIKRKIGGGKYNRLLAPKLWMYWVESGRKQYEKEFLNPGEGARVFPPAVRREVAQYLADREYDQIQRGEYGPVPLRNKGAKKGAHSPTRAVRGVLRTAARVARSFGQQLVKGRKR
jgi:hypothetical protein